MITILAAELAAEVRPAGQDERSIAAPTTAYRQVLDRLLIEHAGRVFAASMRQYLRSLLALCRQSFTAMDANHAFQNGF
ncbi:hypothetical protein A4R29_30040 (plasmid) [Mesorhizobium ciceri biovar biserrulae]|nr:hypothetical protein A4R29_30040 [Mesorhizobium ciceri biovar biserrulae]